MKFNYTLLLIIALSSINIAISQTVPDNFPKFNIIDNGSTSKEHLLGGVFSANPEVGNYNFILDKQGNAIIYKPSNGLYCKMHRSGLISSPKMISGNKNIYHIYDNDFNLIDSVQMANGYFADSHDFKILPNGHYLMVAYNDVEIDMSEIVEGGHPNANVIQAIIQELDANKNPVFQWKSLDYIPVTDSYSDLTAKNIDYIHVNSMFIDDDGNLLISCRSTTEIIKISRQTGEIIWRMGGKKNQFIFIDEHEENAPKYFAWQHDAKILPNGHLLFFDNGSTPSEQTRDYSRVVEYEIDEINKTAKLVWEYRHVPDISSYNEGNVERLENGNTVINWGGSVADGAPVMTEVDSSGNLVYEVSCSSQDIRAYIETPRWRDDDFTLKDSIEVTITSDPITFNDPRVGDLGITIIPGNIYIGNNGNEMKISVSDFAPVNPRFNGKSPRVLPKRVLLEQTNIISINTHILFNADSLRIENPEKITVYQRNGDSSFLPLETQLLSESKIIVAKFNRFGEFIFCYPYLPSIPIAPILNKPEDDEIVNQKESIKLRWSPVGFIEQLNVEIATDENFQNIVCIDSVKTDFYDFANPLENNEYFWRVKCVNYTVESDWSETWRFSTSAPFIKIIDPNGGEQLHKNASRNIIRWVKNTYDTVRIELHKNGEIVSVIRDDFYTTTEAYPWTIAKSIPLDTGYTIKIISLKDSTLFVVSENSFSIIDTTVGINERSFNSELSISNYPNPAKNSTKFEFYLHSSGIAELNIFNTKGEIVANVLNKYLDSGEHYFEWNTSKLVSGEYYCRLSLNGFFVTNRLIIYK